MVKSQIRNINLIDSLSELFKVFLKDFFYYFFIYIFLTIVINAVLTSVITFFHFQLNHSIQLIETWLAKEKWPILIFSKMISFGFIYIWNFNTTHQDKSINLSRYFKLSMPSSTTVLLLVFQLFFFYLYYNYFLKFDLDRILISQNSIKEVFFNSIYYFIDFLYIILIIEPKKILKKRFFSSIIFSIFFLVLNNIIIPYPSYFLVLSGFIFFILIILHFYFEPSFINIYLFLFLTLVLYKIFIGSELIKSNFINSSLQDEVFSSVIVMNLIISLMIIIKRRAKKNLSILY